MPHTKFWTEMKWTDFAAAEMSKTIAVLPVAAIEQHGPHLPVGVDTFINEGYLKARGRPRSRRYPRPLSACSDDRQIEMSTSGFPRDADLFAGDGHARLVRDRRKRGAHRLPQAHLHEFAWRQCARDRRCCPGTAHPLQYAGGSCGLACARLSGGALFCRASARTAFTAATPRRL